MVKFYVSEPLMRAITTKLKESLCPEFYHVREVVTNIFIKGI